MYTFEDKINEQMRLNTEGLRNASPFKQWIYHRIHARCKALDLPFRYQLMHPLYKRRAALLRAFRNSVKVKPGDFVRVSGLVTSRGGITSIVVHKVNKHE